MAKLSEGTNRCLHAMQPKHHQRLPKAHYYYKAKPRKTAEFASLAPFVSEKRSHRRLVLTSHSSSLCLLTTRTLSETRYAL